MIIGLRPEVDQEGVELAGIGKHAEGGEAGETDIGDEAGGRRQPAEAERQRGGGERLAGGDPAPDDGDRPVAGIAHQRPARGETPAEHLHQRRPHPRQHVDVMMPVDEIGRHAGHLHETVELTLDLAADLGPVDRPADRPADKPLRRREFAGRRQARHGAERPAEGEVEVEPEGKPVGERHRRFRLRRPVRHVDHGAGRRQPAGGGEREDALRDAARHREVVGAQDDRGAAAHARRPIAASGSLLRRIGFSSPSMPISSATT